MSENYSNRIEKSFFDEAKALPFAEAFYKLWPKNLATYWFWHAFQALEKNGLTFYESDEDEIKVREKLTALFLIYYEFCHISAFHESNNFKYLDQEIIEGLKSDLSTSDVNEVLYKVYQALNKYFGSEEKVLAHLWINCLEGSVNSIISLEEKNIIYTAIFSENYNDVNFLDVKQWYLGGIDNFKEYESIAI